MNTVTGEKLGFLSAGVGVLILIFILYAKRGWFARITTELMFPLQDPETRQRKAKDTEDMFRILLGLVAPTFMVFWLLAVALQ